jgi:MSHA biogenesis protein MshQ
MVMKKHYFIGLIIPLFLLLLISAKATADTCFTDDFNRANGNPGTNWTVSSSGLTLFNPTIVSQRLRLTDADFGGGNDQATMARLNLVFPGAGNMISVEFDYFVYGGTGADGIAIVLSDSAVAPIPGAYGGSLGYAQKNIAGGAPQNIPGFAGGWIGIGIDEYGNFSNPTEGRVGGPGARANAASVRGSGSGYTSGANNYRYYFGTAAGATTGSGYRYRIIIDHRNGINAWVSIEQDTTGTGTAYVQLLPAPYVYDALVQVGQATVPTSWWLSFTGSTGGSDNTHEIDNLSICTPGGGIKIIKWREVIQ